MAQDANFLPWQRAEKPTAKTLLQERLEGQQVSRLHFVDEPGPTGSRMLVFELTTGGKLIVMAGRDRNSAYTARLLFRWMNPPMIILPRMARAFSGGRDADPEAGPPNELQRYIEGAVIHGVLHSSRPTSVGGEQCAIEFVGGGKLALGAVPIMRATEHGPLLADLLYEYSSPEPKRIVMP